jgi:4-amino-4-deoxy-L-arabinose transferase-like glycosyltransferase
MRSTDARRAADAPDAAAGHPGRREWLGLIGLLLVAAATRLPEIAARGRWNADQGDQMLAVHDFVTTGAVPLLGPLASTGLFHHGPFFYWLIAPAALVSGSDPAAVALWLAVLGLAAVAATWWLGRLTGGPVGALAAGLLAAVSSSGIESSTFIWNPNPIALFAALAAVGVVQGHRTGRARWWLLAAGGGTAVVQFHALAAVFLVPVAGAWLWETLRARRGGRSLRPYLLAGLAGPPSSLPASCRSWSTISGTGSPRRAG